MSVPIDDVLGADAQTCASTEAHDDQDDSQNNAASAGDIERRRPRHRRWKCAFVFRLLPALAILLAGAAGWLRWQDSSVRESQTVATQSMRVAADTTIAMLSYQPDTVEKALSSAQQRLTGEFRDSYTKLINDVVIPGSKQQRISAVATVPAVASVSATEKHAVVLVFVNQTTTIGDQPSTATVSSVRVTLEKVDDKWLVSQFEPV